MNKNFKATALKAALKSGRFIRDSVGKVHKISYKGRTNIVTDVDKKSEAMIIRQIKSDFPDHSILSEEGAPQDKRSPYRWIIDPIDGTTNFAHGFPFFSVSIALEKDGDIILGIVHDPMRSETFIAQKGGGATLNGKKITVSGVRDISQALLGTGFAYGIIGARNKNIRNFSRFLTRAQAIRRPGSAALDVCYVACGRFDGFWEMDLKPWDIAAASLIAREAGGVVSQFNGQKHSHYQKQLLASNPLIHKQMVNILSK